MRTNLDGVTLLRYAHIYRNRTSGGVEQYLKQLNNGLLARNRMTILQMYLELSVSTCSSLQVEVEERGLGRIIWVPVGLHTGDRSVGSLLRRLMVLQATKSLAAATVKQSISSTVQRALANSCGHLRYSPMVMSEVLVDLFDTYRVDLAVFHRLSYDMGTLVSHAARRRIPYGIIQHFDNSRLCLPGTRRWVKQAAAVGGVSSANVPAELQDGFVNLSDAVDTDFFSSARASPISRPEGFLALLAGRVVEGKGHLDMLLALKNISESGTNMSIVFAGNAETESLVAESKKKASQWGLRDRVLFLGELTSEQLRDWYAACDVAVLPSSFEGLGRVLLEAQAMGKPVIAYESGGMPDALVANTTGFLVRTGDHAALGERLRYLNDNPDRRFAMGQSGREFMLQRFSTATLVARHERFYSRVLSGRPYEGFGS